MSLYLSLDSSEYEIRNWAREPDGIVDPDWDSNYKGNGRETLFIELAADEKCPRRAFFVYCLFLLVRNTFRCGPPPLDLIERMLVLAEATAKPWLLTWVRETREAIATFDTLGLCDGAEIVAIANAEELDAFLRKELYYCGCARGDDAMKLLRGVLRILPQSGRTPSLEAWREAYQRLMETLNFDATPGLATWFLYLLDGRGVVTHGSNVTECLLTRKGVRLLDAIERHYLPRE